MIPLLKHLWFNFVNDELFVRRWGRAILGTLGTSGVAFADQLAALVSSPRLVVAIKVAAAICALVALAIPLGEMNEKKP